MITYNIIMKFVTDVTSVHFKVELVANKIIVHFLSPIILPKLDVPQYRHIINVRDSHKKCQLMYYNFYRLRHRLSYRLNQKILYEMFEGPLFLFTDDSNILINIM